MPDANRLYSVEIPEGNDFVEDAIECLVAAPTPQRAARLFMNHVSKDYGIEELVEVTVRDYGPTTRDAEGVVAWDTIEMTKIEIEPEVADDLEP